MGEFIRGTRVLSGVLGYCVNAVYFRGVVARARERPSACERSFGPRGLVECPKVDHIGDHYVAALGKVAQECDPGYLYTSKGLEPAAKKNQSLSQTDR